MSRIPVISRAALVLALALLIGSLLAAVADAEKRPANGVSIAQRVQNQQDLCLIEGGTFSKRKTPFGTTITNCVGGSQGDIKCVNTKKHTDCTRPFTLPPQDPYAPAPTTGNAGGIGAVGTGTSGGGWSTDIFASVVSDDQDQGQKARAQKDKDKKRNRGGKRRR